MKRIQMQYGQPAPLAGLGGRLARSGALGLAAVAVGFLMCGCGAGASEDASSQGTSRVQASAQRKAPSTPVRAVAASVESKEQGVTPKSHMVANAPVPKVMPPATSQSRGLPPDIVVTVSDTVATPGALLHVTARATGDVSQIVLRDGIGDSQGLVYDDDAKEWRLTYRVPLRASQGRVGLSLTARNRDDRWCRVWTFVRVKEDQPSRQIELTVGS